MGFLLSKPPSKRNSQEQVEKIISLLGSGFSIFDINRRLVDIPEVRIAINTVAETISTVPFYHVRERPVDTLSNQRKIEYVEKSPFEYVLNIRANKFQSPQVFKTSIISRLLYNNNVFIMPEWDITSGGLKALYPLPATHFEFQEVNGIEFIVFSELGTAFVYDDIIHLQRFPDIKHGAKKQAVYTHTDIIASMQQAAVKQLESAGKIKAVLISTQGLKDKDMKKQLEEFKNNFLTAQNTTGFGMMNGNYSIHNVDFNLQEIDINTMNALIKATYNYFGVSEGIISKTASELEYQQYINGIEPTLLQISETYSFNFFPKKALIEGEKIIYDRLHLEISTLSARSVFLNKSVYEGLITRNEGRRYIGFGWIKDGDVLSANKNSASMKEVNDGGKKDDSNPKSGGPEGGN